MSECLKQLEALSGQALLLAKAEGLTLVRNARRDGYVGVSQRGQRYNAEASIDGRTIGLGTHGTMEEAAMERARCLANYLHHLHQHNFG